MTYCIAVKLHNHLVFTSDSRTNAGPDHVNTYSKSHVWGLAGERQIVLLSAGNLATTQAVVTRIERDITEGRSPNLHTFGYISEAADYVGALSAEEQQRHGESVNQGGYNAEATFLLGGQIAGQPPDVVLIYPQGNHIVPPESTPFLQIGETKYGKPILDRIIRADTPLDDAVRCALVSMDSTMRSNVTVGPPIEVTIYERDTLRPGRHLRLEEDNAYLLALRRSWGEKLIEAFSELPPLDLDALADRTGHGGTTPASKASIKPSLSRTASDNTNG